MPVRYEVTYPHCWSVAGRPAGARGCSVEQFQEGGKIVSYGNVLHKCANHRDVPDAQLVTVLRAEGMAVKEARSAAPPEKVTLIRFEGAPVARRCVPVYLDKVSDG